jgi:transposase
VGLKRKRVNTVYSVQFKADVLHFIQQTGASLHETAVEFGLSDPSLIAGWTSSFEKKGIEGLTSKSKEGSSMSKQPQKKGKNQEKELTSQQKLERENELLRLENAYLKKLKAFREDPEVYLEKHKQRWHSNSNKHSD